MNDHLQLLCKLPVVVLPSRSIHCTCNCSILSYVSYKLIHFPTSCIYLCYNIDILSYQTLFSRPHKKDENRITRQRYCWELWHRSSGYFTVIAGLVNVTLGVFLIIPPLAVWIVWLCAILVWIVVFSIYETVHLLK